MTAVINRMKVLLFLLPVAFTIKAQNLNNPNKIGPIGTQVNTLSGNLFIPRTDMIIPARALDIVINFSYNSYNYLEQRGFGNGWSFMYNIMYKNDTLPGGKIISWGDGRADIYDSLPGGIYKAPKGFFTVLSQYQAGKYKLRQKNGVQFFFDNSIHKRITRIEEPNGNYINFNYTDTLLTSVSNAAGQIISFTYTGGKLATVTDAITTPVRAFTYSYDIAGNLTEVKDPMGNKTRYSYLVNGPMKTITDKNNNTVDIIYFSDFSTRELIGCNKRVSFSYDTASKTTIATDHLAEGNQVTRYTYERVDNMSWIKSITGNCCGFNISFEHNEYGNKIKQTDAKGNIYSFAYDDNGNVLKITNPLGQSKNFTYTADFNKVKTFTDVKGNVYTYDYDANGNLTRFTKPGNNITAMGYAANGDITSITDPNGNQTTLAYDSYGNLLQVTTALSSLSFVTNGRGNITSYTDARNFTYSAEYDLLNRVITMTNPAGKSAIAVYDAVGNMISFKNEKGQEVSIGYDASNRVVRVDNAKGHPSYFSYDGMDNLLSVTDPAGNMTEFAYDRLNRLTSKKDAIGNVTTYDYDANGNLVTMELPSGLVLTNVYDNLNRIVSSRDAKGVLATVEYDANNNVIRRTGPAGSGASMYYDDLNRIVKVVDALGKTTSATYDNNGNMLSIKDRDNKTRNYVYDELNRVTSFTNSNGNAVFITWDNNGNIKSLKDQLNNLTTYTHDNLNRLTRKTYHDGSFFEYGYDDIGNVISHKATDGGVISFQYDSINCLVKKTLPGNIVFDYTYDKLKQLLSAVSPNSTVNFTYDAIGRKLSETLNGKKTGYAYDDISRTLTTVYPDSTIILKEFTERGLLASILKDSVEIVNYMYNTGNRLVTTNFANGITSVNQYDFANRQSSLRAADIVKQDINFSFDNLMNKTAKERITTSNSYFYSYDNNKQLINYKKGSIASPLEEIAYQYDQVGNRRMITENNAGTSYGVNNLNQLTSSNDGGTNIVYTYDAKGNLTFDGTFYKQYDAENRIISDSASPANKISYQYDALGRRLVKNVNGRSIQYSYAGLSQIQQLDVAADTVINTIFFSHFLKPVMMQKGNEEYYYHPDEQNSVEAISQKKGRLVERYEYDPFGNQVIYDSSGNIIPNSVAGNRFGFTGQEYDNETGFIHFPYRQYNPKTGAFSQRDPLGYNNGMGLYNYARNNPVNRIDPLGLEPLLSDDEKATVSEASSVGGNAAYLGGEKLDAMIESVGEELKYGEGMVQRIKDLKSLRRGLGQIEKLQKLVNASTLEQLTKLSKYKDILGKTGNVLGGLDIAWKIYLYVTYEPDCPGSDEDLLQQAIMWKDMTIGPLGFASSGGLVNLMDYGVEKVFGTSASTAITKATFYTNEYMDDHLIITDRWGNTWNFNPLALLNGIAADFGEMSVPIEAAINSTYDAAVPYMSNNIGPKY